MNYVFYYIVMFGFWILITHNLSWPNVIAGSIITLITTLIFGRYLSGLHLYKLLQPKRYFWFLVYLSIFIWECFKANFDVAYRVLHPKMPIKPGIVKVKLNLKTSLARTILANSITMTPGTITVDIIDDYIYVHWIYVSTYDPAIYSPKISGRFEKYIQKIFE
jgi:multicomponent Na+:H+ antiporter subunit E